MSATSLRVRRVIAALALAACSPNNPPFKDLSVSADTYLPTVLAPGAQITFYGNGTRNARASVWSLDDGGFVAALLPMPTLNTGDVFKGELGLVRAGPTGAVATEKLGAFFLLGTSLGKDAFLAGCGQGAFSGLASSNAPLARLQDVGPSPEGYSACQGVYGRGATADRFIQAMPQLEAIFLHTLDRAAMTRSVAPLFAGLPAPAGGTVRFVDEPAVGQVAVVVLTDQSLVFLDPKSPVAAVTATGLSGTLFPAQIWRGKDGALRIATTDSLWRWDTAQAAVQKLTDRPPSPTGTPWIFTDRGGARAESETHNPLVPAASPESIPVRMAALVASDDAFTVVEPPLTPCCDRDACRVGGESYLVGAYPAGATNVVFYDVWSWQTCLGCAKDANTKAVDGLHALVAAPAPASCGASSK